MSNQPQLQFVVPVADFEEYTFLERVLTHALAERRQGSVTPAAPASTAAAPPIGAKAKDKPAVPYSASEYRHRVLDKVPTTKSYPHYVTLLNALAANPGVPMAPGAIAGGDPDLTKNFETAVGWASRHARNGGWGLPIRSYHEDKPETQEGWGPGARWVMSPENAHTWFEANARPVDG